MSIASLLIIVINFLIISILPAVFFRRDGKLTLMWLLTALPYAAGPIASITLFMNGLGSEWGYEYVAAQSLGIILAATSIFLIGMTMGTHRIPLALWHQANHDDQPVHIVTWGAYKYIRHPFYCAFILTHLGNCLIAPHWANFAILAYTLVLLQMTAAKEEKRLSNEAGDMGVEYRQYMSHTGRFFPKLFTSSPATA